jgi:hypothetical protein
MYNLTGSYSTSLTGNTYQDLTNLTNLYNQSGKIILTGNKDVDHQILIKLDIQNLSKLCRTNKYTQELCDDEDFWKKKFIFEKLPLSLSTKPTLNEWLVIYKKTKISQLYTADTLKVYDIQYKNSEIKPTIYIYNIIKVKNFNNIIKRLYNISINTIKTIKILPDTKSATFIMIDNSEYEYILTETGLTTLFIFIYFYPSFDIQCDYLPLIIDDLYIQNYDDEDDCAIIFERYGILKSINYNKS